MADITNVTIIPTGPSSGVSAVGNLSTGVSQGLAQVLSSVTPGSVLTGFVVNRDASGNPILRTQSGDVAFSSQFFINIGSEVSIRVAGGNGQAHIVSVDGQPPQQAAAQSAFAGEPEVIVSQNLLGTSAASNSSAVNQPSGNTPAISALATVLAPTASSPLPEGTQIAVRILAFQQPPTQAAPPPPAGQASASALPGLALPTAAGNTAQVTAATQAASSPQAPNALAAAAASSPLAAQQVASAYQPYSRRSTTPPGADLNDTAVQSPEEEITPAAAPSGRSAPPTAQPSGSTASQQPASPLAAYTPIAQVSALPGGQPKAEAIESIAGQIYSAAIIGNEVTGEALAQTPLGIMRLQTDTALPPGSQLTFSVGTISLPQEQVEGATPLPPLSQTQIAGAWPALQQIFTILEQRYSDAGMAYVPDNMPWIAPSNQDPSTQTLQKPHSVFIGLMAFVSALRGGKFTQWLGEDDVEWLKETGHEQLLHKAQGEFNAMARQFTESSPTSWQPLYFPVAVGSEIHQARLFVKRDPSEEKGGREGKASDDTRFVLEMDLSQLGEMQMDGFVRKGSQNMQFDLMIRSNKPLPSDIQQDITRIYADMGELSGYNGNIIFQNTAHFPVNPMQEIVTSGIGSLTA